MKGNGKLQNALRGYRQGGIGMKKLTALLLALALTLAMLGTAAEGLDEELVLGESTQANDEPITIGDNAADEGEEGLGLAGDAILDGDGLVVDEMSLDGLEDNLLTDGLPELETVAEAPANDLAGNESNPEDFKIDENGVLVEYVGPGGDVVIPDGVTAIGKNAFSVCDSLTSVTIPDGVTYIGDNAFEECYNLRSVTIPDSVTSIDRGAFFGCKSLTSVTIPNSVTSIDTSAFSFCYSLTSVTIPDSVTSIGDSAFRACSSLTSVTIPDSVTSIGEDAFYMCDSLTNVTIGAGVSIDDFIGCWLAAREVFELTENNTVFALKDGVLYSNDMRTLVRCPRAKTSVTIADSVTSIVEKAFSKCESLTSVTIPDSVTSIGDSAFSGCSSLTSVTIPDSVISIGEYAFSGCSNLTGVTIPDSVISIGEYAFDMCDSLTNVTIGAGVSIDDLYLSNLLESSATEAFNVSRNSDMYASKDGVLYTYDIRTLLRCPRTKTSVTIPDSVTSIGDVAFSGCSNLTSVTIPNRVTSIGRRGFFDCSSLTRVTIPNSVTSLDNEVFYNCFNLKDVFIPASVISIGREAFHWTIYELDWYRTGKLKVNIHGYAGSYAETYARENEFKFSPVVSLAEAKVTVPAQVYSGKALKPAVKVVLNGKKLREDIDYIVAYKDNIDIGMATVTVTSEEYYTGTATGTFRIDPKAVTDLKLVAGKAELTASWTKSVGDVSGYQLQYGLKADFSGAKKATVDGASTVKATLKKLNPDETYYVRIRAFKKIGETTYWSAWSGAEQTKVKPADPVSLAEAKVTAPAQVYSGEALKPAVKVVLNRKVLKEGTDYTVSYNDNTDIGAATVTVTGVGAYTGTATGVFKIDPKAVTGLKLVSDNGELIASWEKSAGGISGYQLQFGLKADFSGAKKATVDSASTVKATMKKLNPGETYYVRIRAFKKIGETTYWSAWSGAEQAKVKPADPVSLAEAKVTAPAQVYTGKALKPAVKVVLNRKTLKEGTDYTVSYKNNKAIGTATVTVAGVGAYTGTATGVFKINPKAVTGLKLAAGKAELTASWTKSVGGVSGYQLQYGLKADFSGAKKSTVNNAATAKATLKKLKPGETYYVRIRAFKKIGKTTYWSAWSGAKKVKVK